MHKLLFSSAFIFCFFPLFAQNPAGTAFPLMETEDLQGNEVILPEAFEKKHALVGLARSKKAEEDLRSWQRPIYNKFVAKTGMMDAMFDVEVFFIPVFTGASKAAKGKVVKKLKENNDPLVRDHLLVFSGSTEAMDALGMDDKKQPYFFLIDSEGEVIWSAKGKYRQNHMDEIEVLLTGGKP